MNPAGHEAHQRIVQYGAGAKLRVDLVDAEGEPLDTEPTVTVTAVASDGTTVLTAAATAADPDAVGRFTADLTDAAVDALEVITATWSEGATVRARTTHLVVAGRYFTRARLGTYHGLTNRSTLDLDRARDHIEDLIERETGVAWTRRLSVETFRLRRPSQRLLLEHLYATEVRWCTIGGTAVTPLPLVDASGVARRSGDTDWPADTTIAIAYEHGTESIPQHLADAAVDGARWWLLSDQPGGISPRARSHATDVGTTEFVLAGRDRPTGIPDVDAVILAHRQRRRRVL